VATGQQFPLKPVHLMMVNHAETSRVRIKEEANASEV
jgi:hypothetical protein